MHSLEQCLADLYQRGLITYNEALGNANQPATLKSLLEEKPSVSAGALLALR